MIKDPKALIAVAVVAILVIAGVAVVVSNNNNGGNKSHDNLADMTWDEIVEKARGTDVNIGFYFDQPCMNWFNDVMKKQAKELYDINLECIGYKTASMAVTEYTNTGKITYDFLWGRASDYAQLVNYDGKGGNMLLQGDWESKMPNMKYSDGLADESWKATYESMYGEGKYSRDISSVAPFSGSTTSFVYNTAFNDPDIKWNEVKITSTDGKTVKTVTITTESTGTVLETTTPVADIDTAKTYTFDSVRAYRVANQDTSAKVYYGLPHNYTELYNWSKVYQEQFYLPSPTGGSNFHVQLILEAMIYELASKGESWIACTDETADVWSGDLKGKYVPGDNAKNKATYMAYINEKILKNGTDSAKYGEQVPYLKAYLEDAAPYWNKALTGTADAVTAPNRTLVGNNDTTQKDFSSSTIMIALNSTESLANRTYMYEADIGVYAPDTVCSNRCGLFLMENSPNPYGAIVVANLFNDPANQASYYSIAGNGYNVDLDTLSAEQKQLFDSRWIDWDAYGKPYVSPEAIQSNMVMPAIGYLESKLSEYANAYIKAA